MRDQEVIAQPSQDTLVLFHMGNGEYFTLNESGARIWELCDGNRTADDIAAAMADEYDVAPEALRDDVLDLIANLSGKMLLKPLEG